MKNQKNIDRLQKYYSFNLEKALKVAGWREKFILENFYIVTPVKANNRNVIELITHETDAQHSAYYDLTNNIWC